MENWNLNATLSIVLLKVRNQNSPKKNTKCQLEGHSQLERHRQRKSWPSASKQTKRQAKSARTLFLWQEKAFASPMEVGKPMSLLLLPRHRCLLELWKEMPSLLPPPPPRLLLQAFHSASSCVRLVLDARLAFLSRAKPNALFMEAWPKRGNTWRSAGLPFHGRWFTHLRSSICWQSTQHDASVLARQSNAAWFNLWFGFSIWPPMSLLEKDVPRIRAQHPSKSGSRKRPPRWLTIRFWKRLALFLELATLTG